MAPLPKPTPSQTPHICKLWQPHIHSSHSSDCLPSAEGWEEVHNVPLFTSAPLPLVDLSFRSGWSHHLLLLLGIPPHGEPRWFLGGPHSSTVWNGTLTWEPGKSVSYLLATQSHFFIPKRRIVHSTSIAASKDSARGGAWTHPAFRRTSSGYKPVVMD